MRLLSDWKGVRFSLKGALVGGEHGAERFWCFGCVPFKEDELCAGDHFGGFTGASSRDRPERVVVQRFHAGLAVEAARVDFVPVRHGCEYFKKIRVWQQGSL